MSSDTEIDDNVVVCLGVILSNELIHAFQAVVALIHVHFQNFRVRQVKWLLLPIRSSKCSVILNSKSEQFWQFCNQYRCWVFKNVSKLAETRDVKVHFRLLFLFNHF